MPGRCTPVTTAAALLDTLDAALLDQGASGGVGGARPAAGLAAATRLDRLLHRHHLVWDDIVAPGSRLAKLCGRLGSEFEAERAAAYDHAVRWLLSQNRTWSALVRLPEAVAVAVPIEEHAALSAASLPGAEQAARVILPPDGDWMTSVQHLRQRAGWRSATECRWLLALEERLASGVAIDPEEANQLREIWWYLELNTPGRQELLWPGDP